MNTLLSALKRIDVAALSYTEWVNVGMALKSEGYDCSVWDDWSKADKRYKPGECERKWKTFEGCAAPVTGATIVQMAKDRGWSAFEGNAQLDWSDTIEYDGENESAATPVQELITYLETLFDKDDIVGFVTGDTWQDGEGRWMPSKGYYDRTAGELIASLRKYPDDLGATVGDWKKEAGAWIRFNPLDGRGVKNENVTKFKYALVESDSMPIFEQKKLYRELELPIACLVFSGGKSVHAIVRVDAKDYDDYRERVAFLYDFLDSHGMTVDKQNRNPSRLSRMPGVDRNGIHQKLLGVNLGRKSWDEWKDAVAGIDDDLPDMVSLGDFDNNLPTLPEELIKGILRRGHKMLISGSSKAGKSFLLMELCIALAEGKKWLGFECKKSKVLYVNLEIDPASCIVRFEKIYAALGYKKENHKNIIIWNLRGHAVPLDELVPILIHRIKNQRFDAVVIDPIYKVITGDENNASDMAAFCNQFDKICAETGCSTIYCHHHSKGTQGAKKAMDRASGSGVFARDPDAQLDMIQLDLSKDMEGLLQDGNATAWRLESSLREFPNIKPINFWFEYPIHRVDTAGNLSEAYAEGSAEANLSKSGKRTTPADRRYALEYAFQVCAEDGQTNLKDIAEYTGLAIKTIRRYIDENSDIFYVENSVVRRRDKK